MTRKLNKKNDCATNFNLDLKKNHEVKRPQIEIRLEYLSVYKNKKIYL